MLSRLVCVLLVAVAVSNALQAKTCGGIGGWLCPPEEVCSMPIGTCNIADGLGVCVPKLDGCPDQYDPVCGCDGKTYPNECEALMSGAAIDKRGKCHHSSEVCGGIAGRVCGKDKVCKMPIGSCQIADAQGVCVPKSDFCTLQYDPVCGCDGKTYGNECEALQFAGMTIAKRGECESAPVKVCGGIAGTPCDEGEVCNMPVGSCNVADLQGECVQRPEVCTADYSPVCGCDGNTYSNDCSALASGVAIDRIGECETKKNVCGGISDLPCEEGEVCMLPEGTCNIADLQGECVQRPEVCTADYSPVCGCDGRTYSNACSALGAGVNVDRPGECASKKECGGIADTPCDEGEVCLLPVGTCATADQQGECVPKPEGCLADYTPVCGCDGNTYSNACEALVAGVNVEQPGECQKKKNVCGGFAGIPCDEGQVCKLPDGQCTVSDLQGECVQRPDVCTADYTPVCGCDGNTYSNACSALAAGMPVDRPGECGQKKKKECGGRNGKLCKSGEMCRMPHHTCNAYDMAGVCVPRPDACTEEYAPVCACDGNTYSNECVALLNNTMVDYVGECAGAPCPYGGGQVRDGWGGAGFGDNWCNQCSCRNGAMACTKKYCGKNPNTGKGCDLGAGIHVPNGWHGKGVGQNWCNSCNCNENGLMCTKMMCPMSHK